MGLHISREVLAGVDYKIYLLDTLKIRTVTFKIEPSNKAAENDE